MLNWLKNNIDKVFKYILAGADIVLLVGETYHIEKLVSILQVPLSVLNTLCLLCSICSTHTAGVYTETIIIFYPYFDIV